jgi:resuscitation-promoting factor RpfA
MRVTTIILRVSDMARSLEFYRDGVGLRVLSESAAFSFLDAGTVQLALNQPENEVGPDESLTEIVLEVGDIGSAHRAMSDRGVAFRIAPREVMRRDGRPLHAADFRDPDGHLFSITGWVDAD